MKIDELKAKVDEAGLVLPVIRPFYEDPGTGGCRCNVRCSGGCTVSCQKSGSNDCSSGCTVFWTGR